MRVERWISTFGLWPVCQCIIAARVSLAVSYRFVSYRIVSREPVLVSVPEQIPGSDLDLDIGLVLVLVLI